MNAVTLQSETYPSSSHGIVFTSGDHRSAVIVGRFRNSADDGELARGARANLRSDRNLKRRDENAVVDDCQLAVH